MNMPEFWVLDEDFYTLGGPYNHFQDAVDSKDATHATNVSILMTVSKWRDTNGNEKT